MRKRKISVYLMALLFACLLAVSIGGYPVEFAEANFMPISIPQPAIVITSDGSVNPTSAPIQHDGNHYIFTNDIYGYTIASERDNIVLDGNGFKLRGNGSATGIFLNGLDGVTVKNMDISGFTYGIRLFAEEIFGGNSSGNSLTDNMLTGNKYGIYMSYTHDNTLRSNRMENNTYNFWIRGGYISELEVGYRNDIDVSNMVDGKPIVYYVNRQGETAPSDAGFVAFVNCSDMTAQGLSLSKNSQGILVVSTTKVLVTSNHVTGTDSGIYLYKSTNALVTKNTVSNSKEGIRGYNSSNNPITSNTITSNEIGVYFTNPSTNNTISKNTITASIQDGVNLWGSTNTSLTENTIAFNNETGINLFESYSTKIAANNIANNTGIGIKLWFDSSQNTISENTIAGNTIGIVINDSYDNTVTKNTIQGNLEWGMRFEDKQNNNVIYLNNFIDNRPNGDGLQVSVTGVGFIDPKPGGGNIWDNGTVGNYWSDYNTRYPNATGNSGMETTPYYLNENNIDRHPIREQVAIPELQPWITLPLIFAVTLLWTTFARKKRALHR
jgi:parallel beta-helix repeat protein